MKRNIGLDGVWVVLGVFARWLALMCNPSRAIENVRLATCSSKLRACHQVDE